jgi:hypothetical protein
MYTQRPADARVELILGLTDELDELRDAKDRQGVTATATFLGGGVLIGILSIASSEATLLVMAVPVTVWGVWLTMRDIRRKRRIKTLQQMILREEWHPPGISRHSTVGDSDESV